MHEGHEHGCCGASSGCGCAHTHEHTHTHSHEHTHDHPHDHSHAGAAGGNETVALLDYMLQHNQHHAHELEDIKNQLETMGKPDAARQLDAVIDDYNKGNLRLAAIVAALKE